MKERFSTASNILMTTENTPVPTKTKLASRVEVLTSQTRVISLPEGVDYNEAITWLKRKRDEEEREVNINRTVDGHPFDAAHCLGLAITSMFGFGDMRSPTAREKFFEGRPEPTLLSIPIDAKGNTVPVMWGDIQFPGIEGYVTTGIAVVRNRFCLRVAGKVKRKHERIVAELMDLTEQFLKTDSIYKGSALRVSFQSPDEVSSIEDLAPQFMDLVGIQESDIIFADETKEAIHTNLFTPIKHTEACRAAGVPIKRGVLLCGKYGTGKTLTANVTASLCEKNGWTFIYAKSISELDSAIEFAKRYQPAVVFAEDLDEVVTKGRDAMVNKMLNTIDGIDNKTSDVMVVLTTNHVERINPAMLRPSRLDALIVVEPPDAKAAEMLLRRYGKGQIAEGEDLTEVGNFLAGHIPAIIQEIVERSKLGAIYHNRTSITAKDLLSAAGTMENQINLIKPEVIDEREPIERGMDSIAAALESVLQVLAAQSQGAQPKVLKPSNGQHQPAVLTGTETRTDARPTSS